MGSTSFSNKVVGIFRDHLTVNKLLSELNNSGFGKEDISVLARDLGDKIVTHSTATYTEPETMSGIKLNDDCSTTSADVQEAMNPYWVTSPNNEQQYSISGEKYNPEIESNLNASFDERHGVQEKDPNAMVKGATTGGVLGLIAGIGLLMIPGVGPAFAAGPLAVALTGGAGGAAIGASAGTLIGMFNDEGIPSDRADFYNLNFNKGNVLVVVHTDNKGLTIAKDIISSYKPETIDSF